MNKDAIRFPASFYKCLSSRKGDPLSPKSLIKPRTIDLIVLIFLTSIQPLQCFYILTSLLTSMSFLFFLCLCFSRPTTTCISSSLHLPTLHLHTLLQVCLLLGLWRGEYKVNDCSDAAGGTMHWWVGWFQAERVICEFFISYPETILSGDSHIFRHVISEKLFTCPCQTGCQIR